MTPWDYFDIEYSICNRCANSSECFVVADVEDHYLCAYLSSQPDIIQILLLVLIFSQLFIFFIILIVCIYRIYQPKKKIIESYV